MIKTALVTGYSGQDGTFLTEHLLKQGYRVLGLARRISTEPPRRVRGMFDFSEYLDSGKLELVEGDLLSVTSLINIINKHYPDEIYNLAAQSHVGVSFKQPEFTIEADFMGVVNLITAIESINVKNIRPKLYQASTSEMFGDYYKEDPDVSMTEHTPLRPNSPYAIAKMAAHQYCKMKREQGMFISCGILFNHESEIRGGDFVTQKIARGVAAYEAAYQEANDDPLPALQLGNLDAMRDWGYAGDYVRAMHLMLQADEPDDYVVGTGVSHSVREFVEYAFTAVGHEIKWDGNGADEKGWIENGELAVKINPEFYRPNDVNFLNGDSSKIKDMGWEPTVDFPELVKLMVKAARESRRNA